MDKQEFGQIMAAMHAAYPNEKVTRDTRSVHLWFGELKDMDYEIAAYALERHIRTNKFPPAISEILMGISQKNRFNNFLPRNYDFEKLERELLMAEIQEIERIEDNEPYNRIEQSQARGSYCTPQGRLYDRSGDESNRHGT